VDPTVGKALVLAGYDRDFARVRPVCGPVRVTRVPGWRTLALDAERGTVAMPRGVRLDLGATAKALAADRAAAAVAAEQPGVGVLVNLGGDIATAGPAPEGGWTVRIAEDHRAPERAPGTHCRIASGALATSSTTVRRWGPGRHHLIDPRTGRPADGPWRTATVAAATCVDANIASTAAIVLGTDAPEWLAERGLPARVVGRAGDVLALAGWPAEERAAA
jgi:thiamine biosynthesis lipoprotein